MFKLILFYVSITFVISLPLNIPKLTKNLKSKVCPWGIESSVFGDNRCYIFHEFPLNYYNSEEFCEGYGATLAIKQQNQPFYPDGEKSYWLGAQNLVTPNQWKWVDGSLLNDFENWNSGEPINATEERCLSGKVGSGKWFTSICYSEKPAVCVYPKVSENSKPTPPHSTAPPSTPSFTSAPPSIPSIPTTQRPTSAVPTNETSNPCKVKGWEYFQRTNLCYFLKEATNFYYDETFCQQQSGHLASIHDFKENEFIIEIAETKSKNASSLLILMGLHKYKENQNSWSWSDSTLLDYSIWDSKSLITNTTRCAVINADQSDLNGYRHWKYSIKNWHTFVKKEFMQNFLPHIFYFAKKYLFSFHCFFPSF